MEDIEKSRRLISATQSLEVTACVLLFLGLVHRLFTAAKIYG